MWWTWIIGIMAALVLSLVLYCAIANNPRDFEQELIDQKKAIDEYYQKHPKKKR